MTRTLVWLASAMILLWVQPAAAVTWHVASNGADGGGCGKKTAPCRSIGQAITSAAPGDAIVVGPGTYGDLNGNGTLGDIAGEENPALYAPGCGCMVAINKSLTITSSNGAGATVIDARTVDVLANVLVIAAGVGFGKPAKGFTVTRTASSTPTAGGIIVDGVDVALRGNLVINGEPGSEEYGVHVIADSSGSILVADNLITGWRVGIFAETAGTVSRGNQISQNFIGIAASAGAIQGNVVTANYYGLSFNRARVTGNAVYANGDGVAVGVQGGELFTGNNVWGNLRCGLYSFSGTLQATDNFWGAASGPGGDPADIAGSGPCGDDGHGNVGNTIVTPFATKPFKVKATVKP